MFIIKPYVDWFNKYLLSVYYVPGHMNKKQKVSGFLEFTCSGKEEKENKY